MSAPSGVSNSSLSMRANTDYDMDDFTGRHDHRVGGVGESNWRINFAKICFLPFLPLYFLIGTTHNVGKGWFFLLLVTAGMVPLLYESYLHPESIDKELFLLILIGSMMFLVSALQVQKEAPVGGLGIFLCIQFCIFIYYLYTTTDQKNNKIKNAVYILVVIVAIFCLMPKSIGTIFLAVLLSVCFVVWFAITFGFISDNLMPDILSKMSATVSS